MSSAPRDLVPLVRGGLSTAVEWRRNVVRPCRFAGQRRPEPGPRPPAHPCCPSSPTPPGANSQRLPSFWQSSPMADAGLPGRGGTGPTRHRLGKPAGCVQTRVLRKRAATDSDRHRAWASAPRLGTAADGEVYQLVPGSRAGPRVAQGPAPGDSDTSGSRTPAGPSGPLHLPGAGIEIGGAWVRPRAGQAAWSFLGLRDSRSFSGGGAKVRGAGSRVLAPGSERGSWIPRCSVNTPAPARADFKPPLAALNEEPGGTCLSSLTRQLQSPREGPEGHGDQAAVVCVQGPHPRPSCDPLVAAVPLEGLWVGRAEACQASCPLEGTGPYAPFRVSSAL